MTGAISIAPPGRESSSNRSLPDLRFVGNVLISVEDNGLGLPEKGRDQLLEPYVTTKKKGSGLGLAIVKKIMEDHEGSVVLENSVVQDTDTGAKATIVFPRDI